MNKIKNKLSIAKLLSILKQTEKSEEYAIILDVDSPSSVQAITKKYFNLIEVTLKENVSVKLGETVYIGQDKREKIHHISGPIKFSNLTNNAKSSLHKIFKIEDLVNNFIEFIKLWKIFLKGNVPHLTDIKEGKKEDECDYVIHFNNLNPKLSEYLKKKYENLGISVQIQTSLGLLRTEMRRKGRNFKTS